MTRTLLQQALGALHPQANRAFVEATKDALRSALAAPQPEPVAYVPRCHTDGNYCIVGEYKWDEIEEKPFGLADPAHWECAALYAAPPAAPAPAVPEVMAGPMPPPMSEADEKRLNAALTIVFDLACGPADPTMMQDELVAAAESIGMRFPAPAVPDLKHKPTVQRLMDLARKFRSAPGDLYDGAYKELQSACYEALSAAPAVREPQDERIRWRDAVIKEAESALRTAEQEFADMPTWANVGHAAKKVTHALAVIAALGIGGGGK